MPKSSSRFEDILDTCVTAIQERDETVAGCLAQYPHQRDKLEPLLRLTVSLEGARTLKAPPEFRRTSAIRVRNLAAANQHRVEQAGRRPNSLRLAYGALRAVVGSRVRLPVVITISIMLVGSAGVRNIASTKITKTATRHLAR